jgi:site-specific recombinase XerD
MFDPGSVSIRGPLAPYADGFWAELQRQGYAPLSASSVLRVVAHFSRWLQDHKLSLDQLSEETVATFMADRRREGYTQLLTPQALAPLIEHLERIGIQIRRTTVVETAIDRLIRDYAEYLACERCVGPSAVRHYTDFAREFATFRFGTRDPAWAQLRPSEITDYVVDAASRLTVGHCRHVVTAFRSLLRFLHVRGEVGQDLSGCVPAVAGWRLAQVPKALEPPQVERLLRDGYVGSRALRRDAAIVRLLVRLGLRAGEVAAFELDDIDWRAGEIVVRGKGNHDARLPLPHDVGRAVAAYLRVRPCADTRKVFLRRRAPRRALSSQGVCSVATKALRRIGITAGGSHLLRHTAATQMLRHGASLSEIAHVLRHRHIDTTAIYAKVDLASLQRLARPWPGGAA